MHSSGGKHLACFSSLVIMSNGAPNSHKQVCVETHVLTVYILMCIFSPGDTPMNEVDGSSIVQYLSFKDHQTVFYSCGAILVFHKQCTQF